MSLGLIEIIAIITLHAWSKEMYGLEKQVEMLLYYCFKMLHGNKCNLHDYNNFSPTHKYISQNMLC